MFHVFDPTVIREMCPGPDLDFPTRPVVKYSGPSLWFSLLSRAESHSYLSEPGLEP